MKTNDTAKLRSFPQGFIWGSATASAQIEGAAWEDGKSESVWDRFCQQEGAISDGSNTDVACDHYHRYEEDIELMRKVGLHSYRLSLAWPRIIPEGTGAVNQKGIDFYRRLLGKLKEAGIKPSVTLFHWDLPQVLEDRGGWGNRDVAYAFEDYARVCYEAFDDLVDSWITLNEPAVVAELGYVQGIHAPGKKDPVLGSQAAFHLLLGHGLAVRAYREMGLSKKIGITINAADFISPDESPRNAEVVEMIYDRSLGTYGDPAVLGAYPEGLERDLRRQGRYPRTEPGDFELMKQPIDFLGLNYYMGFYAAATEPEGPIVPRVWPGDRPKTAMGWDIVPEGFGRLLRRVRDRYPGLPIRITENGAAFEDPAHPADGGEVLVPALGSAAAARAEESWNLASVEDANRIAYLQSHIGAVLDAIDDGVPVEAYYLWSFLDNFEWAYGYSKRFGIIRVDYPTQRRIPKESARYYARIIESNALV